MRSPWAASPGTPACRQINFGDFSDRARNHALFRSCVSRERPGIEIGPWCNPIAPKRDGYRTTVIDVREQEPLRQMAEERGIPAEKVANLESVDVVGDASRIGELVRAAGITTRYGWIISSHNLEHLPEPIGFLGGCGELLAPDGLLGMVIPGKRCCFDRFQPHSRRSQKCCGRGPRSPTHASRRGPPFSRSRWWRNWSPPKAHGGMRGRGRPISPRTLSWATAGRPPGASLSGSPDGLPP